MPTQAARATDAIGMAALHMASQAWYAHDRLGAAADIVATLLRFGADGCSVDIKGQSSIDYAV